MTEPDAYRIRQHGLVVARTEGQHSLREVMQMTVTHRQDGPLSIERRVNKRWRRFGEMRDGFPTTQSSGTLGIRKGDPR